MKRFVTVLTAALVLVGCMSGKVEQIKSTHSHSILSSKLPDIIESPIAKPTSSNVVREPTPLQVLQLAKPFTIILHDSSELRRYGSNRFGFAISGYCETNARILHVNYSGNKDMMGKPLPDFDTLGHEVWHLIEFGGTWHPNPFVQAVKKPLPRAR
jgi:hypothetical protein